jgi:Flp pilus assembly protein TadB
MIGAALGLIVIGLVLIFFLPWVGIPVGVIGLLLLVLYLVGFGRRAAQRQAGP